MSEDVEMVRVGRDQYMSPEEAYQKGHKPRLDPPIKGEPFFSRGALWNFLTVVVVVAAAYYLHKWLYGVATAIVG